MVRGEYFVSSSYFSIQFPGNLKLHIRYEGKEYYSQEAVKQEINSTFSKLDLKPIGEVKIIDLDKMSQQDRRALQFKGRLLLVGNL